LSGVLTKAARFDGDALGDDRLEAVGDDVRRIAM